MNTSASDFETETTVGKSAFIDKNGQVNINAIPRPNGVGWKLIQVINLAPKENVLQFFWQKEKEDESQNGEKKHLKLTINSTTLKHQQ